jgi:hypothetical protein
VLLRPGLAELGHHGVVWKYRHSLTAIMTI